MPAKNPRINEALELREDRALADMAADRGKGFDRDKALRHDEVWG